MSAIIPINQGAGPSNSLPTLKRKNQGIVPKVGNQVIKHFNVIGKQWHKGVITNIGREKKTNKELYHIVYRDGDEEDLYKEQIQDIRNHYERNKPSPCKTINLDLNLTNVQEEALRNLAYLDMKKDFVKNAKNVTTNIKAKQLEIINDKLNNPNITSDDVGKDLGLILINFRQLLYLFKMGKYESDDLITVYSYLCSFFKVFTNLETEEQQRQCIRSFLLCFCTYGNTGHPCPLKFWRGEYSFQCSKGWDKKKTLYWVDASVGASNNYQTIYDYITSKLKKQVVTLETPATHLDDTGLQTESWNLVEGLMNHVNKDYLKPRRTKISVKNNSKTLINATVYRLGPKFADYGIYVKKFYDLNCKQFEEEEVDVRPYDGGTSKINITIVWDKLKDSIFKNGVIKNSYDKDEKELDLCIKANKTMMDMLKQIYAIQVAKENNYDLISVFNDQNAAKIMATLYKGFVIYTSKTRVIIGGEDFGRANVILKRRMYDILKEEIELFHVSNTYTNPLFSFGKRRDKKMKKISLKTLNADLKYLASI